uniref:NADH-ubiquinone oxidoreductase chain 6 n=1 Tax=Curculionoidea sp. 14 KM-2017 TaxID=2219397 RepID=A0A346RG39_9CUCU|nr:NADH dehydrogenase subunit 6 [Curculionoidea sp. 14 KM-2017]
MIALMLSLSFMFIILNHPLSLGFIMLIQTIFIALFSGMLNLNFWFSYILFLILIGGLMILFIYMTSIASNEKFNFSLKMLIIFTSMLTIFYLMTWNLNDLSISNYPDFSLTTNSWKMNFNKYLNSYNIITFNLIINYLLITLIAVVKLTKLTSSPLRQIS